VASGAAVLQEWSERVGTLPRALVKDAAPAVAKATEAHMQEQIAAGQGPDGKAWQLTAEGKRPLRNAGAAVTVRAIGTVILVRLTGPEVKHHRGIARGRIRRQVIPTRKDFGPIARAIRTVLGERFRAHMGGR
jgi:hypothetical protein